jgi:hypothetical protein
MTRRLRPVWMLLALLTPVLTTAQQQATLVCSVAGQVIDSATGEPLSHATALLSPPPSGFLWGDAHPFRGTNRIVTTDSNGKFLMEAVKPGRYRVWAEGNGFLHGPNNRSTEVRLSPGQNVTDLVLKVTREGIIRGQVIGADGESAAGISVALWHLVFRGGEAHAEEIPRTGVHVRADGSFVLGNIPEGRYYARAALTFYPDAPDFSAATPIDVLPGSIVDRIQIRMRQEAQ